MKRSKQKFKIGQFVRSKRQVYLITDLMIDNYRFSYYYKVNNLKTKKKYWIEADRAHKRYVKAIDQQILRLLYGQIK